MSAPLVLLHGFLGAPDAWAPVIAALGATWAPAQVVVPWLPGHGRGNDTPAADWNGIVDAIARSLPERACVLAGYSMGGRIALGVAARHPERVASLVLVSAHLGIPDEAGREARRREDEALAATAERDGLAALVAQHEARPVLASQQGLPSDVRAQLAERRRGHDPGRIAQVLRAAGLGAMPDLRAELAAASRPTAFVAGGTDATYAALAREGATLARGRWTIVEGAGHDLVLEAPGAVAQVLQQWLERRGAA